MLVAEDGSVENRILDLPPGLPPSALTEAGNYLNARIRGRTLAEIAGRDRGRRAGDGARARRPHRAARRCRARHDGRAGAEARQLIVRGQANLLEDLRAAEDLERIRLLFDDLETQKDLIELLGRAEGGEGVRIFIGSENKLFSLSGSSMIAAPFRDGSQQIVGVLGVIGPTRLNYARIVPMVDYTAKVVSRILEGGGRSASPAGLTECSRNSDCPSEAEFTRVDRRQRARHRRIGVILRVALNLLGLFVAPQELDDLQGLVQARGDPAAGHAVAITMKRGCPSTTLTLGNCFRHGMKYQCVVASYPSSRPALARRSAPSQTEAT